MKENQNNGLLHLSIVAAFPFLVDVSIKYEKLLMCVEDYENIIWWRLKEYNVDTKVGPTYSREVDFFHYNKIPKTTVTSNKRVVMF